MDESPADFGYKSVDLRIEGPFAYGFLSGEKGTHRLVRISPFNAQSKRQTSFAGVETWPILEEGDIEDIDIPEKVRLISWWHDMSWYVLMDILVPGSGDNHNEVWRSRRSKC